MDLIERYIYAVTSQLPQSQRAEVEKELRVTIEDMVADRTTGKTSSEKAIEGVLQELGDPYVLASKYSGHRVYLIGPRWFGMYKMLLIRLLAIIPATVGVILLWIVGLEGGSPGEMIVQALGGAINVGVHITFWVTLGFVIAERFRLSPGATWTPNMLPAAPSRQSFGVTEGLLAIATTIVFAGMLIFAATQPLPWLDVRVPFLNGDLWHFWLPALLTLGLLNITLEIVKMHRRTWTNKLVIATIVTNTVNLLTIAVILFTQTIVNPALIDELTSRGSATSWQDNLPWIGIAVVISMTIVYAIDTAKFIRQFRR